jgi:type IV pilus assembly protein PilY1
MNIKLKKCNLLGLTGLFSLFFVLSPVSAVELQLTDEPLFLNQTVPPALAVTFDDSGSMSWSWMPDSRSFDRNRPSFASSDYNLIYYNPNIDYPPPVKADGSSLPDSNFSSASLDGYFNGGSFGRVNLNNNYRPLRYYYPNYGNITNSSISRAKGGRGSGGHRAFYFEWVGPANATLSQRRNQNSDYVRHDIVGSEEKQNFANWYTYYNTRSKLARAAVSHAFVNFGPDFKVDWQQINHNRFRDKSTRMRVFADNHREDFYDWLFLIPGTGSTPLRRATRDAGELFREGGTNGPYYDSEFGEELTCQQNFHIAISDGSWNSSAGRTGNIDNTSRTLPSFTDGTTASYNPASFFYADGNSSTLADTAFYYWSRDLKTSLDNNVPTFIDDFTDVNGDIVNLPQGDNWWNNTELLWNPKNDPANWQHMVNFNIGLGIEGSFDRDTDLPALRAGLLQWPSTFNDTCFKRDGIGPFAQEETRSCQNHICYSGTTTASPVVDCADFLAPLGDVRLCRNGDNNSNISCSSRIVRRVNRSQGRVDDVWHASLNSRGDYFSAQNPQELADALSDLVANIIKRKGRASAGSISSSIISDGTLSFRTGYDTSNWSGFVVAAPLNGDGTLAEIEWDAACKLTGGFCPSVNTSVAATNDKDSRNIITFNYDTQSQHDFLLSDMASSEINKILDSPFYQAVAGDFGGSTAAADVFIDYIRGDRTFEQQFGNGNLRNRISLLGDVINSSARILRGPAESYNDDFWGEGSPERIATDNGNGYDNFRDQNRQRDDIILVGANDGMLHAFDAGINTSNGGHELWAYIPSAALEGISELANPQYKHESFVDATPVVRDAFINGDWNTVTLGGMRHGGKLFYALNLGDTPSSEPEVLWEFTDQDDSDMGFSYGTGVITRVAVPSSATSIESRWIALVPNGYNSSTNKSALYAIDLETGSLLHEWNTGIGNSANPNGMGSPIAADFIAYDNADTQTTFFGADQGTDFAYAGDLAGNVYRFDMKDIFNSSVSQPAILFDGDPDQPITVSPRLFTSGGSSANIVVIFGTGKYIELSDRAILGTPEQYLIGLKDNASDITNSYSLNDSRIVEQTISTSGNTRTLSNNVVTDDQSWKVELPQLGERLVNAIGRDNQLKLVSIATIIPNGEDPCLPGGESWFMIMNSSTGGSPDIGRLLEDGNADGIFVDGIVLGVNSLTTPGGQTSIVNLDIGGNSDSDDTNIDLSGGNKLWKRRSWHRIIFE